MVAGVAVESPLEAVRHPLFLGDDAFVVRFKTLKRQKGLSEISRAQRRPLARPLAEYAQQHPDRHTAMIAAYRSGAYSMKEIAQHFGVHYATVSRAVRKHEQAKEEQVLECETRPC